MKGQITLDDYWFENFSYGAKCRKEGYTNTWDKMPDHDCEVAVIDHEGHKFNTRAYFNEFGNMVYDATKGKGYDICWWKEMKNVSKVVRQN